MSKARLAALILLTLTLLLYSNCKSTAKKKVTPKVAKIEKPEVKVKAEKAIKCSGKANGYFLPWDTEIYFSRNSAKITRRQNKKLTKIKIPEGCATLIAGYASSREKNTIKLSELRVHNILNILKEKNTNVSFKTKFYGSKKSKYSNRRWIGRTGNQRVWVLIVNSFDDSEYKILTE